PPKRGGAARPPWNGRRAAPRRGTSRTTHRPRPGRIPCSCSTRIPSAITAPRRITPSSRPPTRSRPSRWPSVGRPPPRKASTSSRTISPRCWPSKGTTSASHFSTNESTANRERNLTMTIYNVHIYREMRITFGGIEADTPEAAAEIARGKPTGHADDIEDCDGQDLGALVDVAGDEDYEHSVTIDFEIERQRKAASELLAALILAQG